jgi:hypothetical protein
MQLWVILGGFPDDDHRGQPKCKIQVIIRWLVMFSIYTLHFLGNLILTLPIRISLNLQDFFLHHHMIGRVFCSVESSIILFRPLFLNPNQFQWQTFIKSTCLLQHHDSE